MKTERSEFSKKTKLDAFTRAKGHCEICGTKIITTAEYDHRIPCGLGGSNDLANCVCTCSRCHSKKTFTKDIPAIAKAVRLNEKRAGARPKRNSLRNSKWRKKLDGSVVRRGDD
jgi:5-methylcytosine-specific restriction endonuclease McrA